MQKKIALCSSMQFKKEIGAVKAQLESFGWFVFTPELSEKSNEYLQLPLEAQQEAKRGFIKNHFERIKQSDAILVLNYEKKGITGYIGANTLMEIAVAFEMGRTIYILNPLGTQNCSEEVSVVATKVLDGDVEFLNLK